MLYLLAITLTANMQAQNVPHACELYRENSGKLVGRYTNRSIHGYVTGKDTTSLLLRGISEKAHSPLICLKFLKTMPL
jgi:pseudouridine-5'-phosphate glycosidase